MNMKYAIHIIMRYIIDVQGLLYFAGGYNRTRILIYHDVALQCKHLFVQSLKKKIF